MPSNGTRTGTSWIDHGSLTFLVLDLFINANNDLLLLGNWNLLAVLEVLTEESARPLLIDVYNDGDGTTMMIQSDLVDCSQLKSDKRQWIRCLAGRTAVFGDPRDDCGDGD